MRKAIVLMAGIWAAGCGPRIGSFASVPDGAATGAGDPIPLASRVEYVPHQFAGFAWDQTGIRGSLSGVEDGLVAKRLVNVWIYVLADTPDGKQVAKAKDFLFERRTFKLPEVVSQSLLTPIPEDEFKWTTELKQPGQHGSYRRDFWISWKAFGLNRSPNRKAMIHVDALSADPPGAEFHMTKTTK